MIVRNVLLPLLIASTTVLAQTDTSPTFKDDIPLQTYLDALGQISPAAREGASAYLEAYRRRCGRFLRTVELRQAVADGKGDPTLMAMISAAALRDTAAVQRLSASVSCVGAK